LDDHSGSVAHAAADAAQELASLRARLDASAADDAAAFARVLAARRLPRETEDESRARANAVEAALKGATLVPLEVARASVRVAEILETLADLSRPGWLADAAGGTQLALTAVAAARYNVLANTARLGDEEFAAQQRARAGELLESAREISARVEETFLGSVMNGREAA
ncbi:MAG: cyclodeaminase/cyclohydrolase family protein, partial [Pyrinomonadaceae bacterium]